MSFNILDQKELNFCFFYYTKDLIPHLFQIEVIRKFWEENKHKRNVSILFLRWTTVERKKELGLVRGECCLIQGFCWPQSDSEICFTNQSSPKLGQSVFAFLGSPRKSQSVTSSENLFFSSGNFYGSLTA